jgi:hypothetical protein
VDRTGLEVFSGDGQTFIPMPVSLKADEKSVAVSVSGDDVRFSRLDVYELESAWK